MTRKRIRHEQLANENRRNSIFANRTEGLVKKAEQLQILCGAEIAIIGHQQDGENNAILWPSPEAVEDRVNKFMEFPVIERNKKMVTHESYIEQNVNSERESLAKMQKAMAVKEGNQLLAKKPLDMMETTELQMVKAMAAEMLKKLSARGAEVGLPAQGAGPAEGDGEILLDQLVGAAPLGAAAATVAEDQGLMRGIAAVGADKWFSNVPKGSGDGSLGIGGFMGYAFAAGGGSASGSGGFSAAGGSSSGFAGFSSGAAAVGRSSPSFRGFSGPVSMGGSSSSFAGDGAAAGGSSSSFGGFSGTDVDDFVSSGSGLEIGRLFGDGSSSGFGGLSGAGGAGSSGGGVGGFSGGNN
ncbi:glycine-rich cell wall structural protein 1-like [Andrographis paniculata]|uniref:glycine-rich cell wall structural protein 1-like n=1 Tax=Andrographis paniculata TaxID=175694 RepID=UPI0021E77493|nr:glycine-rich cell wall structural protein 1-like [Andrographis paniculata]